MVRCWGCSCVCAQCGDGDSIMVLQAASSAAAPWGMAWCCWVSCRVLGGVGFVVRDTQMQCVSSGVTRWQWEDCVTCSLQ